MIYYDKFNKRNIDGLTRESDIIRDKLILMN